VVDDQPANLRVVSTLLSRNGHDVVPALTGPEALELAIAHTPDLVLLDMLMPGMDGFELLRQLRRQPRCRTCR
jgi:CheY-like chemotaxis protein